MMITKSLMLAAVAALSLGVGTAMADGPDGSSPDYQSKRSVNAAMGASANANGSAGPIGAGSSDAKANGSGIYFQYGAQQ
jgi:uncharacterized low-complexity protein